MACPQLSPKPPRGGSGRWGRGGQSRGVRAGVRSAAKLNCHLMLPFRQYTLQRPKVPVGASAGPGPLVPLAPRSPAIVSRKNSGVSGVSSCPFEGTRWYVLFFRFILDFDLLDIYKRLARHRTLLTGLLSSHDRSKLKLYYTDRCPSELNSEPTTANGVRSAVPKIKKKWEKDDLFPTY